jgi:hypothetical protein
MNSSVTPASASPLVSTPTSDSAANGKAIDTLNNTLGGNEDQ